MDGDTFKTVIDKLDVYFSLSVLDSTFTKAPFTVALLSGSVYA